jgi:integrase
VKPRSYISYTGKIKVFNEWLASASLAEKPMSEITKQDISRFFIYLAAEKNLDRPTCQKYFLNIRAEFKYALKRELITSLPFDLVVFPKKKKDMSAQVISPEHSKILLEDIKKYDKQLYLATMMKYYCFIRPGTELRLMKVGDLDFANSSIRVIEDNAKNGHGRIVTMPDQFVDICKEFDLDKVDKSLYIFGKRKKPDVKPCSVNMLRYRFNKYRDKYNMPKGYKLYSFKHSGATMLHNTGKVSMRGMMDQLGHSNLAASQHYIKKHSGFINETIKTNFPNPY